MPSGGRRRFLSALSASATALAAGCPGPPGRSSPERSPAPKPLRVLDPVRTEGPPFRVDRAEMDGREPRDVFRTAVSERSDCFREEIPVEPHGAGLLVTTETVAGSIGEADVAFPSRSYRTLKEIGPRSIHVIASADASTPAESVPVYVRAILREGDHDDVTPAMDPDC